MWKQYSHMLAQLVNIVGLGKWKFKWNPNQQKSFDKIKRALAKETILNYPKFDTRFEIHITASVGQLKTVISQDIKPLLFYSRKLTGAQKNHTTTKQELLIIVETLRKFRNILSEQILKEHPDYKHLVHESKLKSSLRRMCWRLLIEEFGSDIGIDPRM